MVNFSYNTFPNVLFGEYVICYTFFRHEIFLVVMQIHIVKGSVACGSFNAAF